MINFIKIWIEKKKKNYRDSSAECAAAGADTAYMISLAKIDLLCEIENIIKTHETMAILGDGNENPDKQDG